ncbi:uncharacterized protein PRCAT00006257001 [Priceomyces carsonii]|uniref:uncharacterized protein n=1 Tax=Priceomyces carsonii TaxID=28549 RepID=UPI002ED8DD82|nr:unnamed protein product [Priceomyces carsonii]
MSLESIKLLLDALDGSSYSILSLKSEFENLQSKLDNPLLVNEEFKYQKEVFSKLKFQYLEQETRDKFLRKISESNDEDISREDVDGMEGETMEKKRELKDLKSQLNNRISDLQATSEEVVKLYDDLNIKIRHTRDKVGEAEHLESQINDLLKSQAPEKRELINNLDIESQIDIDATMDVYNQILSDRGAKLRGIGNDINLKRQILANHEQQLHNIATKVNNLQQHILDMSPDQNLSKTQLFAKWCKEMNGLLLNFTNVKNLTLNAIDDDQNDFSNQITGLDNQPYKLSFETAAGTAVELCFSRDLELQSYKGVSQHEAVETFKETPIHSHDHLIVEVAKLITKINSMDIPSGQS